MTIRLNDTLRRAFVSAVLQDVPQVDYDEQMRKFVQKRAVEMLPDAVKKAYKTHPEYIAWDFYTTPRNFSTVRIVGHCGADVAKAMTPEDTARIAELVAACGAQNVARTALEQKLRALVHSVTTCEALVKAAPEFAKYVTTSAPLDRTVPAVQNLVADLTAAGWPKDAES